MNKALKLALVCGASFGAALAGSLLGDHIRKVMGYEPDDWDEGCMCKAKKKECVYGMSDCPMAKQAKDYEAHHMSGDSVFSRSEEEIRWMFCPFGRTAGCPMLEAAVAGETCTHAWQDDCVGGQEALAHNRAKEAGTESAGKKLFCKYGWTEGCDMIERLGPYSEEQCAEAGYECCPAFCKERDKLRQQDAEQKAEEAKEAAQKASKFCPFGEVGCFSPDDFEDGVETCPCADEGCVRKHMISEPGPDAFGGSYGGHGRHAEEVVFGCESDEDDEEEMADDEEPNI